MFVLNPSSCVVRRLESFEGDLPRSAITAIATCTGLTCVELTGRCPPRYRTLRPDWRPLLFLPDAVKAIQLLSSSLPCLSRLVISPILGESVLELTSPDSESGRGAASQQQGGEEEDAGSQHQQPAAEGGCSRWRRLALLDYPGHAFSYSDKNYFGSDPMTMLEPIIRSAEEVDIPSQLWSSIALGGLGGVERGPLPFRPSPEVESAVDDAYDRLREATHLLDGRALPMELTLAAEYCDIALPNRLVNALLPLSYCIRGLTLRGWIVEEGLTLTWLLLRLPRLTRLSLDCTCITEDAVMSLPDLLPCGLTRLDLGLAPRYTASVDTHWQVSSFSAVPLQLGVHPKIHCAMEDVLSGSGAEVTSELIDVLPIRRPELILLAKSLGWPTGARSGGGGSKSNSSACPAGECYSRRTSTNTLPCPGHCRGGVGSSSNLALAGFTLGLSPLLLDELSEEDLAGISASRAAAGRAALTLLELEDDRGAPLERSAP